MSKTKINISEELCNYLYLLSLNIASRENLLKTFTKEYGLNDPTVKAYMNEYYIYDAKYKMAQNQVTAIIETVAPNVSEWDIQFATASMTLTHDGPIDVNAINKAIASNVVNTVDEYTGEYLVGIYDNSNFDDETGLKSEECACKNGGSCGCEKHTEEPELQNTDDVEVLKINMTK